MKTLIKNAKIVTCVGKVYKNGAIEITDSYITAIYETLKGKPSGHDRVIDAKGMIAMPGLVNAHTHTSMTLLRNYGGDLGLEDWLFKKIFPAEKRLTKKDMYYGTLLAGIEMIRSGTTAFADMYLAADEMADAVMEMGLRANICEMTSDPEEKSRIPAREFYQKWGGKPDSRIRPYVMVHSAYLYGEKEMEFAVALAAELDTGIHTHLLETRTEYREGIERYGVDNAEAMRRCGIFSRPVIAAHCVHVTKEDIAILAANGVNVSHNPTSNLKLGSGVAPISRMLDAGINVCLGTDGTASNNNLDMFEEIKLAALLQKGINEDATLLPAAQALRMATANGAKALGFDYGFGTISKGSKADLILIDTDKAHFTPLNDPEEAIVYCCRGSDVDTVMVDGRILMEKREIKHIDEEKIKAEAVKASARIISGN